MGLLRPQIFTAEKVLASFATQPGARVAAMIGTSIWGPMNSVQTVSSLSEFVSTFGDESEDGVTGIKGASLFFRNGGTLKFVRIEDGDAEYASAIFQTGATEQLDIAAKYKGTYGNNIKVTITENSINSGSRDITVTDGQRTESFTNAGQGYDTTTAIIAAINDSTSGSVLIEVSLNSSGTAENVPDADESYLTNGDDGEDGTLTTAISTAYDENLANEEFNFILLPGISSDAVHSTIVGKLNTRDSTEKLYSRLIAGVALNETISTSSARTASGKRITVVSPNVYTTNRDSNETEVLDGSYLACAYAGTLCRIGTQISGTRETLSIDDLSVDTTTGKKYFTKTEQEQLLQAKILPISKIGNALQCVSGITRESSTTSVYFDEVIVDITDFIRASVENYLNNAIGKPNTSARRGVWASGIDSILETAKRNEIIQEYESTNIIVGPSPDTFIATVSVKPSYSVKFINLNVNIN